MYMYMHTLFSRQHTHSKAYTVHAQISSISFADPVWYDADPVCYDADPLSMNFVKRLGGLIEDA